MAAFREVSQESPWAEHGTHSPGGSRVCGVLRAPPAWHPQARGAHSPPFTSVLLGQPDSATAVSVRVPQPQQSDAWAYSVRGMARSRHERTVLTIHMRRWDDPINDVLDGQQDGSEVYPEVCPTPPALAGTGELLWLCQGRNQAVA